MRKQKNYNLLEKKKTCKKGLAIGMAVVLGLTGCGTDAETDTEKEQTEDGTEQENVSETDETSNAASDADAASDAAERISYTVQDGEVIFTKSTGGNPLVGDSDDGNYIYGGDPSVLVDGDTVYLYTGHDTSSDSEVNSAIYRIEEYLCYSTKDMVNWKSEGSVMTVDTNHVTWARDSSTAWASQVVKHYDEEAGKDQYYLYFCSWDKTSAGKQSIGVAVSDSPTGPFVDKGEPLVKGTVTEPESSSWNDIDPTVWVETDDSGEEHRYLAWGNSKYYICELNEDMISVKDLNGDGEITCGTSPEEADILNNQNMLSSYTEAPWLYRRQDEDGNYYGDYYLFYANGWRERMGYATTDNLLTGTWKTGNILMLPTATSNTNHMAVFDFKGETYFVYHNGSLPAGNGYRRSACITKITFNEDGSIEPIQETAAGLNGTISSIKLKSDDRLLSHANFINASGDDEYPYTDVQVGFVSTYDTDAEWVIKAGKADKNNEAYISIEAENKPGLYLTANEDNTVTLSQDTDASEDTANRQTFHTVVGLADGGGVSMESVAYPGNYLTITDDVLCLSDGSDKEAATFVIE